MTIYRTNIAEVASSSVRYSKNEFGFYIACDDRSILKCINSMLLDNGMVGLSDTEGKVHYLIDGRRGGNYVLGRVKEKVLTLIQVKELFGTNRKSARAIISYTDMRKITVKTGAETEREAYR